MKKNMIFAGLLAGLGLGCEMKTPVPDKPAASTREAPVVKPSSAPTTAAAPVYLAGGEGEFSLGELKGQVVVLDFYAAWSPAAEARIMEINQFWSEHPAGLAIVGLVVDAAPGAGVPVEWQEHAPQFPLVAMPRAALARYGGVRAVPSTLILDRNGQIRHQYAGFVATEQVRTEVAALLQEN